MDEHYEFTLVFEYEKAKPIKFKYRIENGDYGIFHSIVNNFFSEELFEEHCGPIKKHYSKIRTKEILNHTLRDIFDRDFVVCGVETISHNTYKIKWAT